MTTLTGNAVVTIDLDDSGYLVDFDSGRIIPTEGVADWLDRTIALAPEVTDIFVFVHGWRNSTERSSQSISNLATLRQAQLAAQEAMYEELTSFSALFVLIRWPSMSNPFPEGYCRIRDRAHAMTTQGHAEFVIAHILGYLNSIRELPSAEPPTLRTNREVNISTALALPLAGGYCARRSWQRMNRLHQLWLGHGRATSSPTPLTRYWYFKWRHGQMTLLIAIRPC